MYEMARQNKVERSFRHDASHIVFGKEEESFSHKMLTFPLRQYVIDKCKAPLQKVIEAIARRWPNPTRENCHHPNTLVWMNVLDKFMEMENNPGRESLFKSLKKIFLAEYEHDHGYYGVRIDVILELWLDEALKGNYKPRSLDYPSYCWKVDPNKRGAGYELIKTCYYNRRSGDGNIG